MSRRAGEAGGPGEHEPGHRGEADGGSGPGLGPAAQSAQAEVITVKQDAAVTISARFHNRFSQSQRRPLLGPSPG